MSDEQMPAWAREMESRLTQQTLTLQVMITATEERLEVVEHAIIKEVGKAITDSEARLTRRLDEIRDDVSVNMARADLAHAKIDADRAEVASLRREVITLYRRLQDVEHRLFKDGSKPPD